MSIEAQNYEYEDNDESVFEEDIDGELADAEDPGLEAIEGQRLINRICSHSLLSAKEEVALFEKYNNATTEAAKNIYRNKIIEHNMRMVVNMATKYAKMKKIGSLTEEDLIQEGVFGLVRAIEKFDLARGYKFSTYSHGWIRQSIQRAVEDKRADIRTPRHIQNKVTSSRLALAKAEGGGDADQIDAANKEFDKAKDAVHGMFFQEEMVTIDIMSDENDDGRTMADIHSELQDFFTPEVALQQSRTEQLVHEAIQSLSERDRKVVIARFGMKGDPEQNLQEIADNFGVTRERIRQIQKSAEQQMGEWLKKRGLTSQHVL